MKTLDAWTPGSGTSDRAWEKDLASLVRALVGGRPGGGNEGPGVCASSLAPGELARLSRASPPEIAAMFGLSPSRAERLAAAFALGRRVERDRLGARPRLGSPCEVARWAAPLFRGRERESFHVLLLDGKHRLMSAELVSEGTLTSSLVHPREVFVPALRAPAAALVVVHNHPSGDPEPSSEDLSVTRRLVEAGLLLGIPLVDHVIVGDGRHVSLRERGALERR